MIISVGQLHSSMRLLDLISTNSFSRLSISKAMGIILVCPVIEVINLSNRCGWIEIDQDGNLCPSKRGWFLLGISRFEERLREQLCDIIINYQPSWGKIVLRGRNEFKRFAPKDIVQCFKESELFTNEPNDDIIRWWDEMANLARGIQSATKNEIGRKGERLSIKYELNRTNYKPIWQSIENNSSGYDLISITSKEDKTTLQIEVKASEHNIDYAKMYITSNEWEIASIARSFSFHLWLLMKLPRIAVLNVQDIEPHISLNNGNGTWGVVEIPFSTFKNKFIPYESVAV